MLKLRYGLLSVAAALVIAMAIRTSPAEAQSSTVADDTWSAKDDRLATVSTSISSSASVVAAVSNRMLNVRAITLTSDTTGVVVFTDGDGGATIGNFYCVANTPQTIYESAFGRGMRTTSGNGIYAVLGSATLTALVRYQAE